MDKLMDEERTYLTLDEVHEELLNLLLRFDAFCKEHNLRYSLDSGTLLGQFVIRVLFHGTTILI